MRPTFDIRQRLWYNGGMIESRLDALMGQWQAEHNRPLSVPELAEAIPGITADFLYRLRNNSLVRIDTRRLAMLCEFFGCGVGELLVYVAHDD